MGDGKLMHDLSTNGAQEAIALAKASRHFAKQRGLKLFQTSKQG